MTEEELKKEIIKRDELIYAMMFNTHHYQNFVTNESIDIDELRKRFKVEESLKKQVAQYRIKLLHKFL